MAKQSDTVGALLPGPKSDEHVPILHQQIALLLAVFATVWQPAAQSMSGLVDPIIISFRNKKRQLLCICSTEITLVMVYTS